MDRYYNFEAIRDDLQASVEETLRQHGLDVYHPLAVSAVLETISSPLKLNKLQGTTLTQPMGEAG